MAQATSDSELVCGVRVADGLALVDKLRRIPDRVRVFRCSTQWARRYLQIRGELLSFLVDNGFPHRVVDGERRFDRFDLYNCGMQLDHGSATRLARRFWPAALRDAAAGRRVRYELQFRMRCPAPAEGHVCGYTMALPGGEMRVQTVPAGGPAPGATVSLTPRPEWPELPPAAREVLAVTRGLEFMALRDEIKRDTDFILRSGLADCAGSALLVEAEARRRDVPVRRSYGYIVVPPFAAPHSWVDFLVDGLWVPVDSLLVETMIRWAVLDATDWSPSSSIGAIVARVGPEEVPPVRHDGGVVNYTLPVRLLPDGD
jgi:hypothetical protein